MHVSKHLLVVLSLLFAGCVSSTPKRAPVDLRPVQATLAAEGIHRAMNHVEQNRDSILSEWRMLTEINAPSGHEQERALVVERLLREAGIDDIRSDAVGNLIARRKGSVGRPVVVVDAHLDTVFQDGLEIRTTIQNGSLHAPGVGDNTRNIEAILAIVRALNAAQVRTKGDLVFLFTVEEENTFRGIDQFLTDHKGAVDHFIALDGGYSGFTYGGIGINWYKHHFIGPGGHTRSRTPPYSATVPLARAISRISKLRLPSHPPTHLNIGMLGGSAVVNAKADDAWFTVDLRSTDNAVITRLAGQVKRILDEEAARAGVTVKTEVISESPAAQIPGHRDSPLVLTSEAVHLAMGFENPPITPTASNHASAALLAGVPAISTGAAPCSDSHALTESCEIEPIYKGIRKIMAIALAMAGVE